MSNKTFLIPVNIWYWNKEHERKHFFYINIHFLDTQADEFTKEITGCISNDVQMGGIYSLYVEMALSGCKYLCQFLHDDACTLIIFIPNARSCILLPWYSITPVTNSQDCDLVELYHRHRKQGTGTTVGEVQFKAICLNSVIIPVESCHNVIYT